MPAGEGSEVDRSEGGPKRQKEREERTGGGARRRIRLRPTRLTRPARPRVDAHVGGRPSSREIRLEEGMNQSSEPARRWDPKRGPCETDDVTRAKFRRLGRPAGHGGRAESGDKIKEKGRMQFRSWARGEEGLIVAKRRGTRDARSGGLNRKGQRTGNDFTAQRQFQGRNASENGWFRRWFWRHFSQNAKPATWAFLTFAYSHIQLFLYLNFMTTHSNQVTNDCLITLHSTMLTSLDLTMSSITHVVDTEAAPTAPNFTIDHFQPQLSRL
jgi:hypothetical protein